MNRWGRWALRAAAFVGVAALAMPMVVSAQTTPWRATLSGSNEVPAVNSTATGTFTADLNETAGTLTWSLSVPSITNATAAHIHTGAAGTNGGIVVNLFAAPAGSPASSINVSGTARATDVIGTLAGNFAGLVTALKAGTLYVNVHTTANPGGEIRGQIVSGATPTATATATATPKATATATAAAPATPTVIAAPKSGTGDSIARDNRTLPWALAAIAIVAAGVALGAGVGIRRGR